MLIETLFVYAAFLTFLIVNSTQSHFSFSHFSDNKHRGIHRFHIIFTTSKKALIGCSLIFLIKNNLNLLSYILKQIYHR